MTKQFRRRRDRIDVDEASPRTEPDPQIAPDVGRIRLIDHQRNGVYSESPGIPRRRPDVMAAGRPERDERLDAALTGPPQDELQPAELRAAAIGVIEILALDVEGRQVVPALEIRQTYNWRRPLTEPNMR